MRDLSKKIITILTLALAAFCLCSCGDQTEEVIEEVQEINALPQEFLDALSELDSDRISELAPGYAFYGIGYNDEDHRELYKYMISRARITEVGELCVEKEMGTADVEITLEYFPVDDFLESMSTLFVTRESAMEAIDDYDRTEEKTIDFNFYYDEEAGEWRIERRTARKVVSLFDLDSYWFLSIVRITPDEAKDVFINNLTDISRATDIHDLPANVDLSTCHVYDEPLARIYSEETDDAVVRFVAAYMRYVLAHVDEVENLSYDKYSFDLWGEAPSEIDLYKALETDEFYTQYYANWLRYSHLGMDLDTVLDMQVALRYNTLADAVPGCSGEFYSISGHVDANAEEEPRVFLEEGLINKPAVTPGMTYAEDPEQYVRCTIAAIELLHSLGEISDEQYEVMLDSVVYPGSGEIDTSVSSSGHVNQAVGTYEECPSWCEDGSIIYGYSEADDKGFMMFYSKEPGWLNTAGYCIDEDGIWIATYYDKMFIPGTQIIADWWLDGEQIVDTDIIEIGDVTNEVEAFLSLDELPKYGTYELRLWEADHRHVVAYIKIMR